MITEFGKALRKIRIDSGELLKDMALKLNVSPAYLSAVEMGKRNVPEGWPEIIRTNYSISTRDYQKLREYAENSKTSVRIPLDSSRSSERDLALSFAREFKNLDDEDMDKIFLILNKRRR
ncbi:MAG: XRE family transcriptional regulator [Clostridiaceae bacterium]|nr:XRE family transcriptional regulator [Clostridiaceae bacterium]